MQLHKGFRSKASPAPLPGVPWMMILQKAKVLPNFRSQIISKHEIQITETILF